MIRRTCTPWTPAEETLLREHYPALGAAGRCGAGDVLRAGRRETMWSRSTEKSTPYPTGI